MDAETGCFDPKTMTEGAAITTTGEEDGFSQTVPNCTHSSLEENLRLSMEELSYHNHNHNDPPPPPPPSHEDAAMEIEQQQQLAYFNMKNSSYNNNTQLMNNSYCVHGMQDHDQQQFQQSFDYSSLPNPELLNLFHLPRCSASSLLPNSSFSFTNRTHKSANYPNSLDFLGDVPTGRADNASVLYDPLSHLNLPPAQPPLFRELLQSLPHGYNLGGGGSRINGGGDDRENGVLEFTRDIGCNGKGREAGETKHFANERQRRQHLNDLYNDLGSLVPNPTKTDKASIVGDAIEYIKELLRTVNELKLLVEKKRCGRERSKRHKTEDDAAAGDVESCNMKPGMGEHDQQGLNGSLRSSWLQRKSKDTEVDVRIVDDEVNIKLVLRKNNCLLSVSKALDELQLDLHHVAGGHIGDFYSFMFNTKIYGGSSVYASAIANKLIEVVERQCAANSY